MGGDQRVRREAVDGRTSSAGCSSCATLNPTFPCKTIPRDERDCLGTSIVTERVGRLHSGKHRPHRCKSYLRGSEAHTLLWRNPCSRTISHWLRRYSVFQYPGCVAPANYRYCSSTCTLQSYRTPSFSHSHLLLWTRDISIEFSCSGTSQSSPFPSVRAASRHGVASIEPCKP